MITKLLTTQVSINLIVREMGADQILARVEELNTEVNKSGGCITDSIANECTLLIKQYKQLTGNKLSIPFNLC